MIVENLKILLTADASGVEKGFQKAAASLRQMGEQLNKLGNVLAGVGAALTAFGGLMVREAANYSQPVKNAVDKLHNSFAALAVQLGNALIPIVRVLTGVFVEVGRWLDSLDPSVRSAVIQWGALAAVFAAVGGVGFKLAGTLMQLAPTILPVLPAIAAVTAAILGVILAVGSLKMAWDANILGMQDKWTAFVNWLGSSTTKWADYFRSLMTTVLQGFAAVVKQLVDVWAGFQRTVGLGDEGAAAHALGRDIEAWAINLATNEGWSDLMSDAKSTAKVVKDTLVSAATQTADGIAKAFRTGLDTLGITDAVDAIKKKLSGLGASADAAPKMRRLGGVDGGTGRGGVDPFGQLIGKLQSRLGRISELIQSAQMGFAAGGPWGAVIAVLGDLLTASPQFVAVIQSVTDGLAMIGKFLGGFLGPFLSITESSTALLEVLALLSPVMVALNAPLQFLANGIKAVTVGILKIVLFIAESFNSLVRGVQGIIFRIADVLGDNFLGNAVKRLGLALEKARIDTTGINDALNRLSGGAVAAGETVAAAGERTAAALDQVTAGLLGAPAGFKIEKYRFDAADPFAASGSGGVFVSVYLDSKPIAAEVQRRHSREVFQRSGAFG